MEVKTHTTVYESSDMTLSELFHDVKAVYPKITIVYLDIKQPKYMSIINQEVHDCLDFYFNDVKPPYIVYSVPEPKNISDFWWFTGSLPNLKRQTISLRENEGVCCDMDSDVELIEKLFKDIGLDKVWVGNGTPAQTLDIAKVNGIKKAVKKRDDPESLSIFKKVEYWTAWRYADNSWFDWFFDWGCDSAMIADAIRKRPKIIQEFKSKLPDGTKWATLEDDPFKVTKPMHQIITVYCEDYFGKKVKTKTFTYPGGTYYGVLETPPQVSGLTQTGWTPYNSGVATEPKVFKMQYDQDPNHKFKVHFETGVEGLDYEDYYVTPGERFFGRPYVNENDREGYWFSGWYKDPNLRNYFVYEDIIQDTTLYAKWEKQKHNICFRAEGKSDERFYNYGEIPTVPFEIPEKPGYEFLRWEPEIGPVVNPQLYVAKYVSEEKVTLSINTQGGTPMEDVIVPVGEIPEFPEELTERTGFDFTGFYYDEACQEEFRYDEPLYENTLIYAGWESDLPPCKINWIVDNKTVTSEIKGGEMPSYPEEEVPCKEGYIFTGWDPELKPVYNDTTFTAKFVYVPSYVVASFNTQGGSYIAPQQLQTGEFVKKPADPVRPGYIFQGWFNKDESIAFDPERFQYNFDRGVLITQSTTFYAGWKPVLYTVKWLKDNVEIAQTGGYGLSNWYPVFPEEKRSLLEKKDYVFTGWEPEVKKILGTESGNNETYTVTYKAQYKKAQSGETSRTVFLDAMGGIFTYGSSTINVRESNGWKIKIVPTVERDGYTFDGWYPNRSFQGKPLNLTEEAITRDGVVFYAKWTPIEYQITWIVNDDDESSKTDKFTYGEMPTYTGETPVKAGYHFIGWAPEPVPVKGNQTYKAQYIEVMADKISVSFNTMGGSYIDTQVIEIGGKAVQPAEDPQKVGCTFGGWYTDSSFKQSFDFNTEISTDTVVYAKWNENKYTVTWKNGDSVLKTETDAYTYGQMPQYGDSLPQKANCVFVGWDPELSPVTQNAEYKAQFVSKETKKHVVYFNPGGGVARPSDYVIVTSSTAIDPSDVPKATWAGHEFKGWSDYVSGSKTYTVESLIDIDGVVFNAQWEELKYTITWNVDGNIEQTDYVYGQMPSYGRVPEKEGYIFTGWSRELVPVTENATYTAQFKKEEKAKVVVSFNTQGGSYIDTQVIETGTKALRPSVTPVKTGYTFDDWYKDSNFTNLFDFSKEIITDTVVYAKWTQNKYTVTWKDNNGTILKTESDAYVYGQMPEYTDKTGGNIPKKDGYAFVGWQPTLAPVKENVTYSAEFVEEKPEYHVVFFNPGGGAASPSDYVIVTDGEVIPETDVPTATWAGHQFGGWYYDKAYKNRFTSSDAITNDGLVLYAKWEEEKYSIKWTVPEDESQSQTQNDVPYGTMPAYPLPDPQMTDKIFTGWSPALHPVTENEEYVAQFKDLQKEKFVVSFNTLGGNYINTQIVDKNDKAVEPSAEPVKAGNSFTGWFADQNLRNEFSFDEPIMQNTVIYAGWEENLYTVNWMKDGTLVCTTSCAYKGVPAFPSDKVSLLNKTGYVHTGWNPSVTAISDEDEKEITYKALYKESLDGRHVVSYNSNGGSTVAAVYVIDGKKLAVPEDPTREGYLFDGWYTEKDTRYVFTEPVTTDMQLIAHWAPVKYEIVWKDGETVLKTESVDYDALPEFGENPEKDGYYFAGWDPSVAVVTGPAIYKAIFLEKEKEVFIVSFNSNGGTHVAVQKIEKGASATQPAKPAKGDYTFVGWYLDEKFTTEYKFTEAVTSDITLYAKWKSNGSSSGGGGGGGGGVILSGAAKKVGAGYSFSPNWYSDEYGVWRIRNSAGQTVANAWLCDDVIPANGKEVWYLLAADGAMIANGLVQDNTGNFYSLETEHNGYFGMLRYQDGTYNCNGQQVYLTFNREHKGSFGAITNPEGIEKLKAIYGVTHYGIGNEDSVYTASF